MNENQNVDDVSIEEVKNLLFSKETMIIQVKRS